MEDEPTFEQEPKDIGEGTTGDPSVLRPTETASDVAATDQATAAQDAGVLPNAWESGAAADVREAEQGVLPGEGVQVDPVVPVEEPRSEPKQGDLGYTETTGSDSVITNQ